MEILYREIWDRFPEVHQKLEHEDHSLSYVHVGYVADWLQELQESEMTPEIVRRVVDFVHWCESQPRGQTAEDDIYTIMVVSFFEKLFESDITRPLIPKLISKEDLIAGAEYLKNWVGTTNYELALRQYYRDL